MPAMLRSIAFLSAIVAAAAFSPSVGRKRTATALAMTSSENETSLQSRRSALQSLGLLGIAPLLTSVAPANAEDVKVGGKIRLGDESIMDQKDHGTSAVPVQENLRYVYARMLVTCCSCLTVTK